MNKLAKEIISEVLTLEDAWDKKTRELRHSWVLEAYHHIREVRFYDEIFFPRMLRAMRLIKAMGIVPEWAWDEVDIGYDEELHGWWVIDPDWGDFIQNRFQYPNNWKRAGYFEAWWDSEDWAWEKPTKEEILALGIRPSLVPGKADKQGNIQPSMF